MNIITFFHTANDIIYQYSIFHAVSDIIFQFYVMLLFHHFNVFGYNSTSIVMFVCFYCYLSSAVVFFLIYLFVTAKATLPKKV